MSWNGWLGFVGAAVLGLGLGIGLGALPPSSLPERPAPQARDEAQLLADAGTALRSGCLLHAHEDLLELRRLTPEDPEVHRMLAEALLELEDPAAAERAAGQALELSPRDPAGWLLRARARLSRAGPRRAGLADLTQAHRLGGEEVRLPITAFLNDRFGDPDTGRLVWLVEDPRAGHLDEALLLAAKLTLEPGLDLAAELVRLDQLAERVRPEVEAAGPDLRRRLGALCDALSASGITVDAADYNDPQNSSLAHVARGGGGLHITTAAVLIAVGRRLGLELSGICAPGQFLVRLDLGRQQEPLFVNPLGWRVADQATAARALLALEQPLREGQLGPASRRLVVIRLLTYLEINLQRRQRRDSSRRVGRLLVALAGADDLAALKAQALPN